MNEMNPNLITRRALALSFIALTAIALSSLVTVSAVEPPIPKPNDTPVDMSKPADMSKPVQVFILLGQSNMVGLGKVKGNEISLEHAVEEKKKYQYLVDDAGAWTERKDVRFVRYMSGNGPLNNEWMTVKGNTFGPEFGIGHPLGNAIDAPVSIPIVNSSQLASGGSRRLDGTEAALEFVLVAAVERPLPPERRVVFEIADRDNFQCRRLGCCLQVPGFAR
jgi:hypothetical protein